MPARFQQGDPRQFICFSLSGSFSAPDFPEFRSVTRPVWLFRGTAQVQRGRAHRSHCAQGIYVIRSTIFFGFCADFQP